MYRAEGEDRSTDTTALREEEPVNRPTLRSRNSPLREQGGVREWRVARTTADNASHPHRQEEHMYRPHLLSHSSPLREQGGVRE